MPELLKVIVDRSKWGRGNKDESFLLDPVTGKMCCLGFACLTAGLTEDDIIKQRSPGCILGPLPASLHMLVVDPRMNSPICNQLMVTNDLPWLAEPDREFELIGLGRAAGIDFEFIN